MKAPVLALFLSIVLIIAGCGASPAAAPPTAEPTVAPPAMPLSEEAALLATMAANAPSPAAAPPTVPLPTPFPTITLGPTAEPRPLPEGRRVPLCTTQLHKCTLTSHRRCARASSRASADGSMGRHFAKCAPVTPATSGEVARYTDVCAPCSGV